MPWSMYSSKGQRKYLTREETLSFMKAARTQEPAVQAFCLILAATGCRISEALNLSVINIDFEVGSIVIHCLKKRGKRVFRAIPIEPSLLSHLRRWVDVGALNSDALFPWSRMTGYRRICEVMDAAGVRGYYATPKGLRHAFGINAVQSGVPLNMVQRWLGHADIKTTAIYTSATGAEERNLAARMWGRKIRSRKQDADAMVCSESQTSSQYKSHKKNMASNQNDQDGYEDVFALDLYSA